ncbi:unnamed protein product [Bemisia tabaci]|uniref:Uncharacterized protein n=1 Tax=Bemisia tabaci TaxID=7038 RepID=A0A9P0F5A0_BEMTA|nr:unnamed protein product [Bemisia tabaci]
MMKPRSQLVVLMSVCCLLGLARPECCPSMASSCGIPFPNFLWQCCSYGDCNIFCCNCDSECKVKGCEYTLVNSTFSNQTDPEVTVSNVVSCSENSRDSCRIDMEVTREFEAEQESKVHLGLPVMELIAKAFYWEYKSSVAEKTSKGYTVECPINPGSEGWLGQEPLFAVLQTTKVYKCCHDASCHFLTTENITYRMPIVLPTGINAGRFNCHDKKLQQKSRPSGNVLDNSIQ